MILTYLVIVKLNGVLVLFLKILFMESKLLWATRMLILRTFSSTFKLFASAFFCVISRSLLSFKADMRLISGWSELFTAVDTEPLSSFFSPKMLGMVKVEPWLAEEPRWEDARLLRDGAAVFGRDRRPSEGEERRLGTPVEARWEEARLLSDSPPLGWSHPEPPAKPCRLRPPSPKPEGAAEEEPPKVGINNLLELTCWDWALVPSFTGWENPGGGLVRLAREPPSSVSGIAGDWRDELPDFTWT